VGGVIGGGGSEGMTCAGLPSREEIDRQNRDMLGKMSKSDVEAMRKEVESQIVRFKP
jgi:hypothetical protein